MELSDAEKRSELRTAYPFGRLFRIRGAGFDLVDIELERFGKPAFRIGAGVLPKGDGASPVDVWAGALPTLFTFGDQVPFIGGWFSLWHWPGRTITPTDIESLVVRVSSVVVPEIEMALREGRCGRHARKWTR